VREVEGRQASTSAVELSPWLQDRRAPTPVFPGRAGQPAEEPAKGHTRPSRLSWKGKASKAGKEGKLVKGSGKASKGNKGRQQSNDDVWGCRESQIHFIMGRWLAERQ